MGAIRQASTESRYMRGVEMVGLCKILVVSVLLVAVLGKLSTLVFSSVGIAPIEYVALFLEMGCAALVFAQWSSRRTWAAAMVFFLSMTLYIMFWARTDCRCFGAWFYLGWRGRLVLTGLCGASAAFVSVSLDSGSSLGESANQGMEPPASG